MCPLSNCVLEIESLEHIMKAPVAAQDWDWRQAVAQKPHLFLSRYFEAVVIFDLF